MVVAVIAVRMVKVTVDEIVHVITMGDDLVTAVGAVFVAGCMARAGMVRRALGAVCLVDIDCMFDDAAAVLMMQMAVVKIVHVPVVLDGGVTAVGTVLMIVILVGSQLVPPPVSGVFGRVF